MENSTDNKPRQEESFSIVDFGRLCLRKWKWILLSLVIFMGVGFLYILRQQPVYERQEQILIEDQESGGMGSMASSFSALGLLSTNTNVYNELIAITSPAVMYEVVTRLNLDIDYTRKKLPHGITLYGTNLPIEVKFHDVGDEGNGSFRIDLNADGSARLYKFREVTEDGTIKYDKEINLKRFGGMIKTPLGIIELSKNKLYKAPENPKDIEDGMTIVVTKQAKQDAVEKYMKKLSGDLTDEDAEVIDLTIKDVSVQRAVDILNTTIDVYNENWIADKNKMAVATSNFITERLDVIQHELGDVDKTLASMQSSTGTFSLEGTAELSLKKESKNEDEIVVLQNQLTLSRYLEEYVANPANKFNIIPVNLGFGEGEAEKQIVAYNELLLQRKSLVANSSENNPLLEEYDRQLDIRRDVINKTIANQLQHLELALKTAYKERQKASGVMTSTPSKALPLLTEERQQKVKEALYLFLLEKREENELSMKFTADNLRVLTPPMGSLKPVAPKKGLIMVIAFLFGLAVPLLYYYISEVSNTKVRSKKDLDRVRLPFAGEIPHVGKKRRLRIDSKGKLLGRKKDDIPMAVVEEGKRDVVNEAFRVIRGNIDFMSGKDKGCQVIMLTSFNPGSGKSFVSYNLGLSFAIKRKRVLLIDCDLRHGSASMFVGKPKTGLTDYLTGNTEDWRVTVKPSPANTNLDVLPIGKVPPNPAELLESDRLKELIEEAKREYDYILLDCPPVNIVVDSQIVEQYADRTLFIVRAGLLDRSALRELNEFYEEKKFKNMSLILNGTEAAHSRYYSYGNYAN